MNILAICIEMQIVLFGKILNIFPGKSRYAYRVPLHSTTIRLGEVCWTGANSVDIRKLREIHSKLSNSNAGSTKCSYVSKHVSNSTDILFDSEYSNPLANKFLVCLSCDLVSNNLNLS